MTSTPTPNYSHSLTDMSTLIRSITQSLALSLSPHSPSFLSLASFLSFSLYALDVSLPISTSMSICFYVSICHCEPMITILLLLVDVAICCHLVFFFVAAEQSALYAEIGRAQTARFPVPTANRRRRRCYGCRAASPLHFAPSLVRPQEQEEALQVSRLGHRSLQKKREHCVPNEQPASELGGE